MNLEELREKVAAINYRIAERGLRAVDSKTGKQHLWAWLPDELLRLLIEEAKRPEGQKTGIAVVKYFNPNGAQTWWFSEYEPETQEFFGKAEQNFKELGYTSFDELRTVSCGLYLWIERDFWFKPTPLAEI